MSFRIVKGKECDIIGIFSRYLSQYSILGCTNRATRFIRNNHIDEWMDCFSLKRVGKSSDIRDYFYWHDCECGLPTIICMTSPFLEHKDINNDQKQLDIDFFKRAELYILEYVLPNEGKVKYPWIDFSIEFCHHSPVSRESYRRYRKSQSKIFYIFSNHVSDKHSVDNEADPQPP